MADEVHKKPPRDEWGCGWEAQRLHQLTMGLDATPAQRLAWLEEMMRIAHHTGALPKPEDEPDS